MKKQVNEDQEKPEKIILDKFAGLDLVNSDNVYSNCHVFKLSPSMLQRDISPFKNDPNVISLEHCHIFKSFDSNGNEQKACNSVGGHYHDVELYADGKKLKAKCSTPKTNRASKELLPNDKHTHDCVYIESYEKKLRKMNADAARIISEMNSKGV